MKVTHVGKDQLQSGFEFGPNFLSNAVYDAFGGLIIIIVSIISIKITITTIIFCSGQLGAISIN